MLPDSDTMNEMPSFTMPLLVLLTTVVLLTRAVVPLFTVIPLKLWVTTQSSMLRTAAGLVIAASPVLLPEIRLFRTVAMALPLTLTAIALGLPVIWVLSMVARPVATMMPLLVLAEILELITNSCALLGWKLMALLVKPLILQFSTWTRAAAITSTPSIPWPTPGSTTPSIDRFRRCTTAVAALTITPLTLAARIPACTPSPSMVMDLVTVTAPKPPESTALMYPPVAVLLIVPAKVLHGAVRLHGFASSPTPDTHVRVACAWASDAERTTSAAPRAAVRIRANIFIKKVPPSIQLCRGRIS